MNISFPEIFPSNLKSISYSDTIQLYTQLRKEKFF